MPEAKECERVNRNINALWDFIKEMNNWAQCMPGFVSFEEQDENTSIWHLKGDGKLLKRKICFTVKVIEKIKPERIVFTIESKNEGITGEGSYLAKSAGNGATDVEFFLKLTGRGMKKQMVNSYLKKSLPKDCKTLKEGLFQVLGIYGKSIKV